jgi:hypothetical protein
MANSFAKERVISEIEALPPSSLKDLLTDRFLEYFK